VVDLNRDQLTILATEVVFEQMNQKSEDEDTQSELVEQWRALASVIDRLSFWITFLIMAAGLLGMFIMTVQRWSPVRLE